MNQDNHKRIKFVDFNKIRHVCAPWYLRLFGVKTIRLARDITEPQEVRSQEGSDVQS
jgi:hypothetical protein